jgi:SAM-dependent methyltransferase
MICTRVGVYRSLDLQSLEAPMDAVEPGLTAPWMAGCPRRYARCGHPSHRRRGELAEHVDARGAVGPGGAVVLSDIAPEMTAIAAERAKNAALTNVTTREVDLERIDYPEAAFDKVLWATCAGAEVTSRKAERGHPCPCRRGDGRLRHA